MRAPECPSVPPSAPCRGPFQKSTLVPVRPDRATELERRCRMPRSAAIAGSAFECLYAAPEIAKFAPDRRQLAGLRLGRGLAAQHGPEVLGRPAERRGQ